MLGVEVLSVGAGQAFMGCRNHLATVLPFFKQSDFPWPKDLK